MVQPFIERLRRARLFLRSVAITVVCAYLGLYLQPVALAARLPAASASTTAKTPATPEEKLSRTLEGIEAQLAQLETKLNQRLDATTEKAKLKTMRQELDALDKQARANFDTIERHLKDKKLPQVILDRHTEAVRSYRSEMVLLKSNLDSLEIAKDDTERKSRVQKAREHLKAKQKKRPHTPVDPNNLPFRVPDAKKTRKPAEKKEDFQRLGLLQEERIQLASTELLPGMLIASAALALPAPADLQPTEDVQITPEIEALAAALERNPVKIYNWVRENIRFLPTYGSIQGSQMTLMAQQGNAFDTASLLIALLRASGIPAHYVYGTIQIPADQAMNWVGGVNKPEAAQQLLGQGGIPNTALISGGKIISIELEQVWVEAYVDFYPSRGAIHKQGDTWVPMDASFKQYQYTQGMDIKTNVSFDTQNLINQLKTTAQINEQESWATGISSAVIQTAVADYHNQVLDYVNSIKPNATVGDVLGSQEVISNNRTVLAASLPYKKILIGSKFAEIPDSLRHKLQLKLYASDIERVLGSPTLTIARSLPSLAGKKVALSFLPATTADQAVIDDAVANNSTALPAYLIQVRPELKIDDVAEATGDVAGMATPQILGVTVSTPWYTNGKDYRILAGDVSVIGINPASISARTYIKRIKQFDLTQNTGASSTDEMLFQTNLAYWAEFAAFTQAQAGLFKVQVYQLPSHGLTATPLSAVYTFGLPFSASYKSRTIDIKENFISAVHTGNDAETTRQFVRHTGYFSSALESSLFDQLFHLPLGTSMSALRAVSLANEQGIRVYTVTQSNIGSVLPLLGVSVDVKGEIGNAVGAGLRAYVPQQNLAHNGFAGTGYIIEDPVTGSGIYKIAGARDGGDSPAQQSVQPLPAVPATQGILFVLGTLARQSGATLLLNGEMLAGIAIPGAGEILVGVGLIILAYLFLSLFLQTMGDIIDRMYPPTRERYRHFTSSFSALGIVVTGFIIRSKQGTFGPGVYLTAEDFEDCPPTDSALIAGRYRLRDKDTGLIDQSKATGYVDIIITRRGFWNIRGPFVDTTPDPTNPVPPGNEYVIDTFIGGLPLYFFGIELDKACTALGVIR